MTSSSDMDDGDRLVGPERAFRSPIPTQLVSNEECDPLPQGERQRATEARIVSLADELASVHGLDRRAFLARPAGMAAAFIAMNAIYGPLFAAPAAEAREPGVADARAQSLADQFIFDPHTHYIRDDAEADSVLARFSGLRNQARTAGWNPALPKRPATIDDLRLNTFVKELYLDSDTKLAILSGAPADEEKEWMLTNQEITRTRDTVNRFAGSKRLMSHLIIAPGQPGWLDDVDRGIAELKPDGIKGYTIGDNNHKATSRWPWRLDDEKLMYPAYERFVKAGIRNVAVHKGLFTNSDLKAFPRLTQYAGVGDVGKAAKDWPQLNFIIYHAAYRMVAEGEPALAVAQFERTGRMDWVSDLAEIPERYGVSNVYGEIGTVFAATCISEPRAAAAMLGILVKGLGDDHVLWGTDSIWYGSPQWQIEAFRRIEIPEAMRRAHGFAALQSADGPVKQRIFGLNAARLFDVDPRSLTYRTDALARYKRAYVSDGGERSNRVYGMVRTPATGSKAPAPSTNLAS